MLTQRHKGICDGRNARYNHCSKPNVLIVCKSRGQCFYCSEAFKKAKKKPVKQKLPKPTTGQLEVFRQIWDTRPHLCKVTGDPIPYFDVWCFAHILSKKSFKRFMLKPENIMLVTRKIHDKYDSGDRSDPIFREINELHDQLISEYYGVQNT